MEYRILGKTGLKVSVVGVGGLGFTRANLCTPDRKGLPEIESIINRALDLGVNVFDTAYVYGGGIPEEGLGLVMKTRRKEAVILSRTHVYQQSDNPVDTTLSLETSLKRLKTDVVDIYQLHDVSSLESFEKVTRLGIYDALKTAKKQGKVRFIGFSTHGGFEVAKKMIETGDVDVLTVSYNILHRKRSAGDRENLRETGEKLFPFAKKFNIGITVMKPLGGSSLICQDAEGKSLSAVKLIRYIVQNPYIHTVTPGIDNMSQLEEDVKAGDQSFALTTQDIKEIEDEANKWGKEFCRQCGYCKPCTQDINIPAVLKNLMEWRRTKHEKVRESYNNLKVKASACTACKVCEERCPYHLPISDMMAEASSELEKL